MPNIKVKYIIDENGDRVAPVTHIDAVRDSDGNGLSEILEDKPDATDLSAVATSGDYSDLENTPTSESAVQDGTDLSLVTTGEKYIWNNKADSTAMVGATASAAGSAGLVPAPAVADRDKFLKGDGTWSEAGGSVKIVKQTSTAQKFSGTYSNGTKFYVAYITNAPNIVASSLIVVNFTNTFTDQNSGSFKKIVSAGVYQGSFCISNNTLYCGTHTYNNILYYGNLNYTNVGGPNLTNSLVIQQSTTDFGTCTVDFYTIQPS